MKKFSNENAKVVLDADGMKGLQLFIREGLEVVKLSIPQGKGLALHSLPIPVTFFVLSGEGKLTVEEESDTVSTGEVVHCAPELMRSWRNEKEDIFEVLVIKQIDPA